VRNESLHEAKNIRGHKGARSPWRHYSVPAAVRATVRPAAQRAIELAGIAKASPKFNTLKTQFQSELEEILSKIEGGGNVTSRFMKPIFRKYYTKAFQLGKMAGGSPSITRLPDLSLEDKRWIETFIRKEFDYWKRFVEDTRSNSGRMNRQQRLEMYVATLTSMYHTGRVLEVPPQTLFYWKTQPSEHCPHCLYLARKSPFTRGNLPTVPASGDTQCKSNCKCKLVTKRVSMVEYWKVARTAASRDAILKGMRAIK